MGQCVARLCSLCRAPGHNRRACPQRVPSDRSTGRRRSRKYDKWCDLEFHEHPEAIEAANRGGMTLEEVGNMIGVTRERVRQIEVVALEKCRTGEGLVDTVKIDGVTFPVLVCDKCKELFPRMGRSKRCLECMPAYIREVSWKPNGPSEVPTAILPPPPDEAIEDVKIPRLQIPNVSAESATSSDPWLDNLFEYREDC
jgi:hypothetical protein